MILKENRLARILNEKDQRLKPGEKLIYINGDVVISRYNNGKEQVETIRHTIKDARVVLKEIGYRNEQLDDMSDAECEKELREIYDQ